jgi:hypothetical protein
MSGTKECRIALRPKEATVYWQCLTVLSDATAAVSATRRSRMARTAGSRSAAASMMARMLVCLFLGHLAAPLLLKAGNHGFVSLSAGWYSSSGQPV